MPDFSFIHAADLHLGTPFTGIGRVNEEISSLLLSSTFKAFDNLVDLAVSKGVDFVVLCGDLFDTAEKNLKALLHFRAGMKILDEKGIQVFIVHGNHDPLDEISGALELPGNCHVFSGNNNEWKIVRHGGVDLAAVFGISFPQRAVMENLARKVPSGPKGLFRIAMLHCTVGKQAGHDPYAPCSLSDLAPSMRVDYWALGHVHARKELCTDPFVVYPGVLQGRNFAEQGEKGAFLVRGSQDGEVNLAFHPLDAARWYELDMDAAMISGPGQFMDKAWGKIEKIRQKSGSKPLVLRICVTGRSEFSGQLGKEEVISDLLNELRDGLAYMDPPIWLDSIKNYSKRPIDLESRRKSRDLVGMLLRETETLKKDPGLVQLAQKELEPILASRAFRADCPDAVSGDIYSLLEDAEFMLLDLLEE